MKFKAIAILAVLSGLLGGCIVRAPGYYVPGGYYSNYDTYYSGYPVYGYRRGWGGGWRGHRHGHHCGHSHW